MLTTRASPSSKLLARLLSPLRAVVYALMILSMSRPQVQVQYLLGQAQPVVLPLQLLVLAKVQVRLLAQERRQVLPVVRQVQEPGRRLPITDNAEVPDGQVRLCVHRHIHAQS